MDLTNLRAVKVLVEYLVGEAVDLGYPDPKLDVKALALRIVTNEQWNQAISGSPRAGGGIPRAHANCKGWERMRIHAEIVESLLTKPRPENEELISIATGGALPKGGVEAGNKAFLVTGPPASGKSWITGRLAQATHSLIVDPDDAKRMLPEYRNGLNAFGLHAESSLIIKAPNGVLDCATSGGLNIVLPTVGPDADNLLETQMDLRNLGYSVYLVNVQCSVFISAVRALERTAHTGRYVPLKYLLCEVGNRPEEAFDQVRRNRNWMGLARFNTEKIGAPPEMILQKNFKIVI